MFNDKKWMSPWVPKIVCSFPLSIIILLLIFTIDVLHAQENKVLQNVQSTKNEHLPLNQRFFLHINKTIYIDTDTIWFKGYSVQGPLQQKSNFSQTMIVALLNEMNEVVMSKQFLSYQGTAEGQMVLSGAVKAGNYLLVAYGSNMLNYDTDKLFRTPIEIRASSLDKYNFSFAFDAPFYKENDPVEMQVHAFDKSYQPYKDLLLHYSIMDGSREIEDGKVRANESGKALLHFTNVASKEAKQALTVTVSGGNSDFPTLANAYVPSFSRALDVQLLPEGGDLVAGLIQMVAFRSVDDVGQPIDIEGSVFNASGKLITEIKSTYQGMGKFMMMPQEGETYELHISSPQEYKKVIPFPEVMPKGRTLSYVGLQKGNAVFKVAKNYSGEEQVTAIWQVDGIIISTQVFDLAQEKMLAFNTKALPTGIAKLSLFDMHGEPFAERLVFVRSADDAQINLNLNGKVFLPRNKAHLDLEILTKDSLPVDADCSVLVTHIADGINPLFPIPDIRDHTFFKSELSGKVFEPWQYFDLSKDANLLRYQTDLVMLTHGWRRFDWYDQLCDRLRPDYEIFNYDLYRGKVSKGKSSVPNAKLDVCSFGSEIAIFEFEADENGRFYVKPDFTDKTSPTIVISTERKNQFSRAKLSMEDRELEMRDSIVQLFHDELLPYVYRYNSGTYKKSHDIDSLFKIWDTKYIDEITVTGHKSQSASEETLSRLSTGSISVLKREDFENTLSDLETLLQSLAGGLYVEDDKVVRMSQGDIKPVAIVLDDRQIRDATFSEISWISSDMIEAIAFVRGGTVAFELDSGGQNGALMIWTTKEGNVPVTQKDKKNKFTSKRYARVRQFYNPKYDTKKRKTDPNPDKRTTLYWNNQLKTDSLGKMWCEFYTGDLKGDFLINIQGVSKRNGPIFKETRFSVY